VHFCIIMFCLYVCRASLKISVYTEWTPDEILQLQLNVLWNTFWSVELQQMQCLRYMYFTLLLLESMASVRKAMYFAIIWESKDFNYHTDLSRKGLWKYAIIFVYSAEIYFLWAIDPQKTRSIKNLRRWRIRTILKKSKIT